MLLFHTDFIGDIFCYVRKQGCQDQDKTYGKVNSAVRKTEQGTETFFHDTENNHGKNHADDIAFAPVGRKAAENHNGDGIHFIAVHGVGADSCRSAADIEEGRNRSHHTADHEHHQLKGIYLDAAVKRGCAVFTNGKEPAAAGCEMQEDEEHQRKTEEPENNRRNFDAAQGDGTVIKSFQLTPGFITVKLQRFTAEEEITEATEKELCAEGNDHGEELAEPGDEKTVQETAKTPCQQAGDNGDGKGGRR